MFKKHVFIFHNLSFLNFSLSFLSFIQFPNVFTFMIKKMMLILMFDFCICQFIFFCLFFGLCRLKYFFVLFNDFRIQKVKVRGHFVYSWRHPKSVREEMRKNCLNFSQIESVLYETTKT